jgi:signal transduction histidine kinase
MNNLFRAFTKIMNNRELNRDGVGLGLTISKNIARALGGDIEVISTVGQGTKFILNFPLSPQEIEAYNLTV